MRCRRCRHLVDGAREDSLRGEPLGEDLSLLARAPDCAALSLLDNALYTAAFALLAANPRIAKADFEPCAIDRREVLAEAILKHSAAPRLHFSATSGSSLRYAARTYSPA